MNGSSGNSLSSAPSGQIIDFDVAELRKVPFQDSLYLWVSGKLPAPGVEVKLAPHLYRSRPDYWRIEVTAIRHLIPANDTGTKEDPLLFERAVPLTGITGVMGIEVIGANKVQRIEITGEHL